MQLVRDIREIKTVLEPEFWLAKHFVPAELLGMITHKEKKRTPLYYELGQA